MWWVIDYVLSEGSGVGVIWVGIVIIYFVILINVKKRNFVFFEFF